MSDAPADALNDLLAELDRFRSSPASLTMDPIRVEDWLRAWGVRVVAALEVAGQGHAATAVRGALRVQTGAVTIGLNAQRVDQVRAWLYQAVRQLGGQPAAAKAPREADRQPSREGVFLSYRRRGGWSMARHVYGALEDAGFDVFMDYRSLGSGEFEPVILNQIAARPHFVLLLGPTSLQGVHDPADWVRREIEHALRLERNVIPVWFDGFSFKSEEFKAASEQCPALVQVSKRNGVEILKDNPEYLDAALDRICDFVGRQPSTSVSPTPPQEMARVQQIQEHVKATPADEDRPYGIGGDRDDWREIPWPEAQAIERAERRRRRDGVIRDIVMEADPAERDPLNAEPHLAAIERFLLLGHHDVSEDFRLRVVALVSAVREFARTHGLAEAEDRRVFSHGHMGKPPDERLKEARKAFRAAHEALSAAWKSFHDAVKVESTGLGPVVAGLTGGSDERNNLRREIKAMLDWLFSLEYEIKRAATKIDPKSHPNGHPPTFLKMPLEDPPELRELSPRTFLEPLGELKKFVQVTKSIVEASRIRHEAGQFPARKSAILAALKRVDAEKRIGLSFPED